MSSNRTYRSALSRDQVLREIAQCSGAQFDPDLARVFVQLNFTEFDRLVTEHQAQERSLLTGAPMNDATDAVVASLTPTAVERREEAA
jgi:HD-GYP domain-containing protein (c-di-GMP phosphodiesterase class II)